MSDDEKKKATDGDEGLEPERLVQCHIPAKVHRWLEEHAKRDGFPRVGHWLRHHLLSYRKERM